MAEADIDDEREEAELDEDAARRDALAASTTGTTDPDQVRTVKGTPSADDVDGLVDILGDLFGMAADAYNKQYTDTAGTKYELDKAVRTQYIRELRKALETFEHRGLTSRRINYYYGRVNKLLRGKVKSKRETMRAALQEVLSNINTELTKLVEPIVRDITSAASLASARG